MDERSPADVAMDRYADGDEGAFVTVYEGLRPLLAGFATRRASSRATADDVVQQTFLQIIDARARWVRGARVASWAVAIAMRLLIDGHRRSWREVSLPERAGDGLDGVPERAGGALSAEDLLDLRHRERELLADVAALRTPWRVAFQLVVFDELSVAEAAELVGISEANVKIRVHRAREALREADARRRR